MNDWKARAEREAAAMIAAWYETHTGRLHPGNSDLVDVVALAWIQGAIFASHLDLQALEMGADDLKAAL